MERRSPKFTVEKSPRTILERLPPKSPVLYERYKSGCAWKLLSFLDFCQSHSNKKPNSHSRHISSHTSGNEYVSKLLKLRKDLDKKSNNDRADTKSLTSDTTEHETKKKVSTAKKVQSGSNLTREKPKKHKNARKTFSRPCYSKDVAIVGPTRLSDKKLGEKSSEKLTSTSGTEEICSKVKNHQSEVNKVNSPVNNDQLNEINLQVKMNESAEAFINQQLIDKDGVNEKSKNLLDALEILNSNKDLFIKLLQDPNSLLVKHIQDLKTDQGKIQQNKSPSEAQLPERRLNSEDHVCDEKVQTFNSRFPKGSDDPSEIVLLKPRPTGTNNSFDNSSEFYSIKFDHGLMNKGQSVKPVVFSLERVKRRLRHAIGVNRKEHLYKSNDIESDFQHEISSADENGKKILNLSIVRHNKQNEVEKCDTLNYRTDEQHGSTRYSPYSNYQVVNEIKRKHLLALARMKKPNEQLQTNFAKPDVSEKFSDTQVHESIDYGIFADSEKASEKYGPMPLEETKPLGIPVEPGDMQIDENQDIKCSDMDSALEIDTSPPCEYACSSNPLFTHEDADPDDFKDKREEPSTLSIPEIFLTENTVTASSTPETNEDQSHPIQIEIDEDHSEFRTSDFNWDDFSMKSLSTVQQLDIEKMRNLNHYNPKLLDDYISEVFLEVNRRCSPWVSTIRPIPMGKYLVSEMKKHVDLDLITQLFSPSLEQLAAKDLAKPGTWLDNLQLDLEDIVIEIVEAVIEELIMETWIE